MITVRNSSRPTPLEFAPQKVSLVGLGITTVLQAILVVITGSVALLSDTLHNATGALTAIPLWIAFSLGRRNVRRSSPSGSTERRTWQD